MKEICNKIIAFNHKEQLFYKNDRLLICVSGGLDSICLLHIFKEEFRFECAIVHVNYKLRGVDSDNDEIFVRRLCEQLHIEGYFKTIDLKKPKTSGNTQAIARELRYKFGLEVLANKQYDKLLTAHHLNDNIETALFNYFRAGGLKGLSGIKPKNNKIIRPFLCCYKTEIESYANEMKIVFRTDKTNKQNIYKRNVIRNNIIPIIQAEFPDYTNNAYKNLSKISQANEAIVSYFDFIEKKVFVKKNNSLYDFHFKKLKNYRNYTEIFLIHVLLKFGITADQISQIVSLFNAQKGKRVLSSTHIFYRDNKLIQIFPKSLEADHTIVINQFQSSIKVKNNSIRLKKIKCTPKINLKTKADTCLVDYDKIHYPIIIRKKKEGDYFYPLGLNKKKKLKKFFVDNKIGGYQRETTLVLETDKKVFWVVGHQIDHRFRVTENSKNILRMDLVKKE